MMAAGERTNEKVPTRFKFSNRFVITESSVSEMFFPHVLIIVKVKIHFERFYFSHKTFCTLEVKWARKKFCRKT